MVAVWVTPDATETHVPALVFMACPSTASVSTSVLIQDRCRALMIGPNRCGSAHPSNEWSYYHSDGLERIRREDEMEDKLPLFVRDSGIFGDKEDATGMALVAIRDPVDRTASSWRKYFQLFEDGYVAGAHPEADFDTFVSKHGANIVNLHVLFRRVYERGD